MFFASMNKDFFRKENVHVIFSSEFFIAWKILKSIF